MICTFEIAGTLPGLNEMTNANRSHWSKGAALKKKTQRLIGEYIVAGRVPAFKGPLCVEVEWLEPSARRDVDNVSSAIKYILDALVETGRIPNDGQRYIKDITHHVAVDPIDPRVIVTLIPMEELRAA